MRGRFLILLIGLLTSIPSYSQNDEYDSVDELISDIKRRNFEKPISYMRHYLTIVENGTEVSRFYLYRNGNSVSYNIYTKRSNT